jgi:hypothetical protein
MSHSCGHNNDRQFPAEINVHFPGTEGRDKPTVWIFPRLLVCLDCGLTQFQIGETQLRQLSEDESSPVAKSMAA